MGLIRRQRRRLGDGQQAFAIRLGLSIRAIARSEKDREPQAKTLILLAGVAEQRGFDDLARYFREGLAQELGTWDLGLQLRPDPQTPAERVWVAAMLHVLRHAEYAPLVPRLAKLLREPTEKLAAIGSQNLALLRDFNALLEQANRWAKEKADKGKP